MLRALLVFMLVLFAAPAMAQEYQSKDLAEAGVNYRQELVSNIPSNKRQPSLIPRRTRSTGRSGIRRPSKT